MLFPLHIFFHIYRTADFLFDALGFEVIKHRCLGKGNAVVVLHKFAGAHQKEICLKTGVVLEHLPRACPELNPVERFFEELRKEMSDHVYGSIEAAENHLCKILQPYFQNKNKIIQLCHYSYIRTQ